MQRTHRRKRRMLGHNLGDGEANSVAVFKRHFQHRIIIIITIIRITIISIIITIISIARPVRLITIQRRRS